MKKIDINLYQLTFSYFGSYMALCQEEGSNKLILRSLRGKAKANPVILTLRLFKDEVELDYTVNASFFNITLQITPTQQINIVFDDDHRLLIQGENLQGLTLSFDTQPLYNFEYNYLLGTTEHRYAMINSYKNLSKNLIYIYNNEGSIELIQNLWVDQKGSEGKATNKAYVNASATAAGKLFVVLEDIPTHSALPSNSLFNIEEAERKAEQSLFNFCGHKEQDDTLMRAYYLLWASFVKPEGYLKRYVLYAANRGFMGVWSWDHCFNALGLLTFNPSLALEQWLLPFDYQDEAGQIPGSVSDSTLRWNFTKPPIQALFYTKIAAKLTLKKIDQLLIYEKLKNQVNFYYQHKDSNGDGLCEYHHGNDSGQDNSTIFDNYMAVDAPDLNAYLIKAIDTLIILASRLDLEQEALHWTKLSSYLTQKFIDYFINNEQPMAYHTLSQQPIKSQSLLPYLALLLGKKLPLTIRKTMIKNLKEHFLTPYGLATEMPSSPQYTPDGYWRGPIWAPTTLLLIDALQECDEVELAQTLSNSFCMLVEQEGFAENFDALTGRGLRDKGFAWTAAVYCYLRQ